MGCAGTKVAAVPQRARQLNPRRLLAWLCQRKEGEPTLVPKGTQTKTRTSGRESVATACARAAAARWIAIKLHGTTCAPRTTAVCAGKNRCAEAAPTSLGPRGWTSDGRSSRQWPTMRRRRGTCGGPLRQSSAHGTSYVASAWVSWARSTASRNNRSRSIRRGQRAGFCATDAS